MAADFLIIFDENYVTKKNFRQQNRSRITFFDNSSDISQLHFTKVVAAIGNLCTTGHIKLNESIEFFFIKHNQNHYQYHFTRSKGKEGRTLLSLRVRLSPGGVLEQLRVHLVSWQLHVADHTSANEAVLHAQLKQKNIV